MLHSSLGYHTFTVFRCINYDDKEKLLKAFENYRDKTKSVMIQYATKDYSCWTISYIEDDEKQLKKKGIGLPASYDFGCLFEIGRFIKKYELQERWVSSHARK
jgi:hypothetical protein